MKNTKAEYYKRVVASRTLLKTANKQVIEFDELADYYKYEDEKIYILSGNEWQWVGTIHDYGKDKLVPISEAEMFAVML